MKFILSLAIFASTILCLPAAPLSFDFTDPKGVNTINFNMDAPLESINGNAKGVTGRVQFDPQFPANTTGIIELDTASLQVANSSMREHMLGDKWMDVKNHPDIRFIVAKLNNVEVAGNVTTAEVVGEITIKGVTRQILADATLTYLKGKLKARMGPRGPDGDLLVIRTKFVINRSDFGINAGQNSDKVADDIEISLSIAGQSVY